MNADTREVEQRLAAFPGICREHGVKGTHQRMEIYRELARTDLHPDADTLFRRVRRRVPAISLDTVYRTLRMLEEKGVIARVGTVDERARFDANTERHAHFVCRGCGRVADVHSPECKDWQAPPEASAVGVIESVQVEFRGLCAACSGKRA